MRHNEKLSLNPGDKFGEWIVIKEATPYHGSGARSYLCRCSCGNERIVRAERLVSGKSKSCGHVKTSIERVTTQKLIATNTSGHKGIHYNKKDQAWEANITYKRSRHYLGQYSDKEDAIQARENAESILKRNKSLDNL